MPHSECKRNIANAIRRFRYLSFTWAICITLISGLVITVFTTRAMIERDLQLYGNLISAYLDERLSKQIFTTRHDHIVLSDIVRRLKKFTHVELVKIISPTGIILWSDEPSLIGHKEYMHAATSKALLGKVAYDFKKIDNPSLTRHKDTEKHFFPWIFEIAIPIRDKSSGIIGLVEIYRYPYFLLQELTTGLVILWLILFVSAAIYLLKSNSLFTKMSHEILQLQFNFERNQRLAMVGKFVSMIVHDTRNLLASIRFTFKRLSTLNINSEQQKQVDSIRRPLEMSFAMMNDLLNYASGKDPPLDYQRHSLASLLQEANSLLSPMLESAGHHLNLSVEQDVTIDCNANNLIHILINLVRNSIEAMQTPGEIYIRGSRLRNGTQIVVQDSGAGIPQELIAILFEPFVSDNRKSRTGLGLSIVHDLVKRHGGTIEARNRSEGGAEFELFFPDKHIPPDSNKEIKQDKILFPHT